MALPRKIVLIGGHPKGFNEPFHPKTRSGNVLRKITDKMAFKPALFDLWKDQEEEDARIIPVAVVRRLNTFINDGYQLIALGRYIQKALDDVNIRCTYLPHPASRDAKYIQILERELMGRK